MFKQLIKSASFRQRVSFFIFVLLVIPFGLFFSANWISGLGHRDAAGLLFGKPVSREAFDEVFQAMHKQWEAQAAGVPESFLRPMITQAAWNKLMLLEEAKHQHVRISDADVADVIRIVPAFQENSQFARVRYELILRSIGMSPRRFEEAVRKDLMIERLTTRIRNAVDISEEELVSAYQEARETLSASLLVISPSDFTGQAVASVTPEEIKARYGAQPDEVRIPERLRIEYAGTSRLELLDKDNANPDQAGDEETKGQRVSRQLNLLALDLHDDLDARHTFDQIAQQRALGKRVIGPVDAATASNALPDPAILTAIQDLATGMMSDVIETPNGVYLARVAERIPSRLPPLEEVQDQIRSRLTEERAKQLAGDAARALYAKLKERMGHGWRFEEAVMTEGRTTTPVRFMRTGPIGPLGYQAQVNEQAFAAPLGQVTDVLETPQGFVMVRPEERIPADVSKLAEERESFRKELLGKKQDERYQAFITDVRERAKLKSFLEETPAANG